MSAAYPKISRTIYYGQPVNWQHPVNRGLQLWWLPLPQRTGTLSVWDLCGRVPGALVNGMAWAGSKGMPYGAWQSDADARINGTVTLLPDVAQTFTITGWARYDSAPGTTIFAHCNRWRIQRDTDLILTIPAVADNHFTTLPIANSLQWYFFAVSLTGTSAVGYLDGVSETIAITAPSSGSNSFYVGDNDFGSFGVPGLVTDFRLYNRVVPPGEIATIRDQGRKGHPDTLNWLSRSAWFVPGAAAPATDSVGLVGPGLCGYSPLVSCGGLA